MKFAPHIVIILSLFSLLLPGCSKSEAQQQEEHRKIVVTVPAVKDITTTQQYVCQIHSRRHIEVRALESGYLEEIHVKEGQLVKQGDVMFKIVPILYQAKLDSEIAEAQLAEIELANTERLYQSRPPVVSIQEVMLARAKLAKAQAQVKLAQAEFNFTDVKAPFDGIIDRQHTQQGSLVEEGDILTTLSDNSVMWVYFNVPESRYLEYKQHEGESQNDLRIELQLANGQKFPQPGKIGAIESDFNNETGNIAFRADFPNPDLLLRHGQTGTIMLHRVQHNAIIIPQRATFEVLDKRYVYVVGDDNVVHTREIKVQHELEDVFVLSEGLKPGEKFVLDGIREVSEDAKVEPEFRDPKEVLSKLKYKAE
jgi:membrane fusion protein (multidrug efflux system)